MSFLFPWLGLGLLGAGVPVWLHLRHRQPRDLVPFPTLRFLEDQALPERGRAHLRDPLLLALRALALLLLVGAFARPFLDGADTVVTRSRVLILDATLSQQVDDQLADDLRAVREAVRKAGPAEQIAVVVLAHEPSVLADWSDERETVLRRLAGVRPSHQRGSYLEAFRLAQSLLDQSLGEVREVTLFGDQQENQWSENETSPPFLRDVEVRLARRPSEAVRPNLSIGETRSRLFFLGDRTFVELSAQLVHQAVSQAEVAIVANGEVVLEQRLDLGEDPGAVTLRARWETDPATWLVGQVRAAGSPDALAADDVAHFCLPPVEEGRVELLARSPYLRIALSPEIMRGRWSTTVLDPGDPGENRPLAELADVLVIEASYAQSDRSRNLLFRYLNNERGVVLLVDRETPLVRGLLRELHFDLLDRGAPVGATGGGSRSAGSAGSAGSVGSTGVGHDAFRYFAVYHPIFRPFVDGELGNLMDVGVRTHRRLRAPGALPLIYGATGDPLLFESLRSKGRLLVLGFGLDKAHTDWPVQPTFIPFLDLLLQHARSVTPLETAWEPGEVYALELGPELRARQAVMRQDGAEMRRVEVTDGQRIRFRVPDRPGTYELTLDDDLAPHARFSVNPSPRESVLRYVSEPPALNAWTVTAAGSASEPATGLSEKSSERSVAERSDVLAQRWWWWLLAGGLLFLASESWMLWRRRERLV